MEELTTKIVPKAESSRTGVSFGAMKKQIIVLTILLGLYSCQRNSTELTDEQSDSSKIVELEHKWVQVALDGDAEGFSAMMADDYVALRHDGKIGRKKPWADAIKAKKTQYEYVNITDINVYLYNKNTAIVTGRFSQKAIKENKEVYDAGSYMNTWTKINGKWIVLASAFSHDDSK